MFTSINNPISEIIRDEITNRPNAVDSNRKIFIDLASSKMYYSNGSTWIQVNTNEYYATIFGDTQNSTVLNSAITATSTDETIVIDDDFVLDANVNFGERLIKIANNGSIDVNGYDLTIKNISCSDFQSIFIGDCSGLTIQRNYITPQMFGAVGDGSTDCSNEFDRLSAVAGNNNSKVIIPNGTYSNAQLLVKNSMQVEGQGASILKRDDYALKVGDNIPFGEWATPNEGVYYATLTIDASISDDSITVDDESDFSIGDTVYICSKEALQSSTGNGIPVFKEFVKVLSTSSNTISFETPLRYDHTTANDAMIFKIPDMPNNASVKNLIIDCSTGSGTYAHGVLCSINTTLENIIFTAKRAAGFSCFSENLTYRNCNALQTYSGFSVARGTISTTFENCYVNVYKNIEALYTMFIEENPNRTVIKNCRMLNGTLKITSNNESISNIILENNYIENIRTDIEAIALRIASTGDYVKLTDNHIKGLGGIDTASGITSDCVIGLSYPPLHMVINNNYIETTNSSAYHIFAGTGGTITRYDINSNRYSDTGLGLYQNISALGTQILHDRNSNYSLNKILKNEKTNWNRYDFINGNHYTFQYQANSSGITADTYNLIIMTKANGKHMAKVRASVSVSGKTLSYESIVTKSYAATPIVDIIVNELSGSAMSFNFSEYSVVALEISMTCQDLDDFIIEIETMDCEDGNKINFGHY